MVAIINLIHSISMQQGNKTFLFNFIEFLYSNTDNFNKYEDDLKTWREVNSELSGLGLHFTHVIRKKELGKILDVKWNIISEHVIKPFKEEGLKNLFFDYDGEIYNFYSYNSIVLELTSNFEDDDIPKILKAKKQYIEFRNNISPYFIHYFKRIIEKLDDVMTFIIKVFWEEGDKRFPTADEIISEHILEKKKEPNKKALSDNKTQQSDPLTLLFSFIDFLHINIDNFNQYDSDILELKKMRERFSQLGFHYTEKVERDALQEGINEKWDVILDNIVNPIKNKVVELDLFDWQAPETLGNNYFHMANTLSKTYDKKDLDAILNAKTQYIEFTNKISPNIIQQSELIFDYLYKVMVEIAKNFHEKGDMPIKHEEARRVDTFEELVEGAKAGEKVSMPFEINNFVASNSQTVQKVPISNTAFSIDNNIDPINDNTMDINYEAIFEIALTYTDDPAEMKEFCIREQKKADRDYFYNKDTFYKGLLKVVLKEKERAKPTTNPQPATMRIGSMFVAGTGGSPYSYRDIERLEGVVFQLLNEDKAPQEEEAIQIKEEHKNMTEQQIFDKINELTTEEYEEKYYLDGYNESTLTTLDPKIIHLTFSEIYSELDNAFKYIYLRGEFDFLKRIKKLLHTEQKKLVSLFEDGEWLVGRGGYENDNAEFQENTKARILIFETKLEYIEQLIDSINSFDSADTQNEQEEKEEDTPNRQIHGIPETNHEPQSTQSLYTLRPPKYTSNQYALAFIFDCLATGVNFMMYDSKKSQLEAIGEKRVNGAISGNTFYKAFNRIIGDKINFKSEDDLIYLAGDNWREIIIDLSHEQEKVSKYIE